MASSSSVNGVNGVTSHEAELPSRGVRLHYVEANAPEGAGLTQGKLKRPCLVLVHGWPEFWYAWRHQLGALSTNYRVIAVDMRGFGRTTIVI
jgi:pimeloyl-ACP methyl ester carboxylesterase